jgi:hypothetical protein
VLEAVKVWPGKGGACRKVGVTANLDSSCARRLERVRIGTKKRALQIEQRNWRRKKCGALPNLLDKKASYKGLGADSEEKHEPVSDIDIALVDSLKALDPKRPIREADIPNPPLCEWPSRPRAADRKFTTL